MSSDLDYDSGQMLSDSDHDSDSEPVTVLGHTFCCIPFDKYKNPEMESGNKIVMPPSYLSHLLRSDVKFPLLFEIKGSISGVASHCGVLEFAAEEACVYTPRWMMKNLDVEEGGAVILRHAELPPAAYMKLRPHAAAFVELANPKAVLERKLRGFSCLSCGDTIVIRHNEVDFYLDVLEVMPGGGAVSLIETDCEVDFAPPLDCEEERGIERDDGEREMETVGEEREEVNGFRPFTGAARRLDGTVAAEGSSGSSAVAEVPAKFAVEEGKKREKNGGKEEFKPFTGRSRVLGGPSFDSLGFLG